MSVRRPVEPKYKATCASCGQKSEARTAWTIHNWMIRHTAEKHTLKEIGEA